MGYTQIINEFNKENVPIGSSEVYKHLKLLKSEEFIVGESRIGGWSRYTITKKGMVAVERIKEIMNTEPRLPKIRMEF